MNYYQILGVPENATAEDIKRAYRKLAKRYHPDINKENEEHFKLITEAYRTLIDPQKRKIYDRELKNRDSFKGYIEDLLKAILEKKRRNSKDIKITLRLSLEEAFSGGKKDVRFKIEDVCPNCNGTGIYEKSSLRRCGVCGGKGYRIKLGLKIPCVSCENKGFTINNPCPKCGGYGTVKKDIRKTIEIPAGIDEGDILVLKSGGSRYKENEEYGDLLIKVKLKKHRVFVKKGLNLYLTLKVPREEIYPRKIFSFKDLSGEIITIKIPENIDNSTLLKVKGRGFRNREGKFGDLFIRILPK